VADLLVLGRSSVAMLTLAPLDYLCDLFGCHGLSYLHTLVVVQSAYVS